ncbi:MAG: hypothetical protein RMJ15_02010 [Nitrososphaerota archaeon]|nr:hypothetical protein [Candidatus Bathyarchaeota archaeon]MDW8022508.1 hypothetical protein [Nitrososphaerota archaeon]
MVDVPVFYLLCIGAGNPKTVEYLLSPPATTMTSHPHETLKGKAITVFEGIPFSNAKI